MKIYFAILCLLTAGLTACQQSSLPHPIACGHVPTDSQDMGGGNYTVISAIDGKAKYHHLTSPRRGMLGEPVTLQYLVYASTGSPRALLVLIPGGQFYAGLVGGNNDHDGSIATAASNDFLVRSARLFAQQGYRVVTVDRPSDYIDSTGGSGLGYYMDAYRRSVAQAVDLAAIVNRANSANLPVILVGTNRGAISAVAQAAMFSAISISSPVTTTVTKAGSHYGKPLQSTDAARVAVPTQVIWQQDDTCRTSTPANSYALSKAFPRGSGQGLSGGFGDSKPCGALSHHGYFGIETCAVNTTTAWLNKLQLPDSRPLASAVTATVSATDPSSIELDNAASGSHLRYSLPFATTTKGARLSLEGTRVRYTPKGAGTDSFVYVVKDAKGGVAFNTVSLTVR